MQPQTNIHNTVPLYFTSYLCKTYLKELPACYSYQRGVSSESWILTNLWIFRPAFFSDTISYYSLRPTISWSAAILDWLEFVPPYCVDELNLLDESIRPGVATGVANDISGNPLQLHPVLKHQQLTDWGQSGPGGATVAPYETKTKHQQYRTHLNTETRGSGVIWRWCDKISKTKADPPMPVHNHLA